jgi:negative regulator of sigma E activity
MTPNHAELLSAFFDGEAVEADALAASLQESDAIEFLVEFARLRRAVYEDASRPTEEFCGAMRERLARGERHRESRRRLVQMSLAASVALAAALGGFTVRGVLERRQPGAGAHATQGRRAPDRSSAPTAQPVSVPTVKTPDDGSRAGSKNGIPSPTLRMRFAEWRDTVL